MVVGWIGSLGVARWLRGLPVPLGNRGRVGAAGIGPAARPWLPRGLVDIQNNSLTHRGSEQLLLLPSRGLSSSLGRSRSFSLSVWKRSDFPGSFSLQQQVGLSRLLLLAPGRCTKNTQKIQEELLTCGCQTGGSASVSAGGAWPRSLLPPSPRLCLAWRCDGCSGARLGKSCFADWSSNKRSVLEA